MIKTVNEVMPITTVLGKVFQKHFHKTRIFLVNDILGEDHLYVLGNDDKPVFDALISSVRKFVFLWYYTLPSKGFDLIKDLRDTALKAKQDLVIKFPNVPENKPVNPNSKVGNKGLYPAYLRFGHRQSNSTYRTLKEFIVKTGNPQLEAKIYTESALEDFRRYDWQSDTALASIHKRAKQMIAGKSWSDPKQPKRLRGYYLYAGCAMSFAFPKFGFGMRDIDVQAFFTSEKFVNTRNAYTRYCEIEEFGRPAYFNKETRWLDLMYNSLRSDSKDLDADVVAYIGLLRRDSDRWATMSQRPFINLETEKVIYTPNWIKSLQEVVK